MTEDSSNIIIKAIANIDLSRFNTTANNSNAVEASANDADSSATESIYDKNSPNYSPVKAFAHTDFSRFDEYLQQSLFTRYNNWENTHSDRLLDAGAKGETYDEYLQSFEAKALSLEFNFMEGKNANNKDIYNSQLMKLAKGCLEYLDTDNDGKLSINEYFFCPEIKNEIEAYKILVKQGDIDKDYAIDAFTEQLKVATNVFNIIDTKMGNSDGVLDVNELRQYYEYLDKYSSDSDERVADGKIGINEVTDYPEYLSNQVAVSDETLQRERNLIASFFEI